MSSTTICGVSVPDSRIAREATELLRDASSDLLFQHSLRVYFWAALTGKRKNLTYDPELLYVGAMFHDFGLTAHYRASQLCFEVDGANAARDSSSDTVLPKPTWTGSGRLSPFIPRRVFRTTCIRKSPCCMGLRAWMSPAVSMRI